MKSLPKPGEAWNSDQLYELGRRLATSVPVQYPGMDDWEVFRRSLGFFQWNKKHNLTDTQIQEVGKGWAAEKG